MRKYLAFLLFALLLPSSTLAATLVVPLGGTGTTTLPSSQLLYGAGTSFVRTVATTSASAGTGISLSGTGRLVGGSGLTISNTGVLSVSCTSPLSCSGATPTFSLGTVPILSGGTATTTFQDGGVVFFDNSLGTLSQDVLLFWDNTRKFLGVASSSPAAVLSVGNNFSVFHDQFSLQSQNVVSTPYVASQANADVFYLSTTTTGAQIPRLATLVNDFEGTGLGGTVQALRVASVAGSSAFPSSTLNLTAVSPETRNLTILKTVGDQRDIDAKISLSVAWATTTNAEFFATNNPTMSSNTLITNLFHYFASGGTGSGTVTNNYGFYVQDMGRGTNRWGFYQAGTSDLNFFAGKTGIGTSSPASLLHVSAGPSATTTVEFDAQVSTSKTCFNVHSDTGGTVSFFFHGTAMVVEAARCK